MAQLSGFGRRQDGVVLEESRSEAGRTADHGARLHEVLVDLFDLAEGGRLDSELRPVATSDDRQTVGLLEPERCQSLENNHDRRLLTSRPSWRARGR